MKLHDYARGWEKPFDSETGFIRPRETNGQFIAAFDPKKPWVGFQEGNAWQYTFYVPHQLPELIAKIGSAKFNERLDTVFAQAEKTGFGGGKTLDAFSGLENTYNHGNQPSLHVAWLFNVAGRPWLTQYWVRRICDEFYGADRMHGYGYGQDEDQGQLGAWFVLAALGLFDIQGGTAPRPVFQVATPLFPNVEIKLDNHFYPGSKLTIATSGEGIYIRAAAFNGTNLTRPEIEWNQLKAGGRLSFQLSADPNRNLGLGSQ